jgi:hypothetical protein
MEGWQVVTAQDEKLGHVVAVSDDYLVVEAGHLRKSRHPIPRTFTHVRESEEEICVSLPKDMVGEAPTADADGAFDREAAARHYGLAEGMEHPPTEGYGELEPDDPAYGPDRDADAAGLMHPDQRRAEIQTGKHHERFASTPSFLGDRKRNNARGR